MIMMLWTAMMPIIVGVTAPQRAVCCQRQRVRMTLGNSTLLWRKAATNTVALHSTPRLMCRCRAFCCAPCRVYRACHVGYRAVFLAWAVGQQSARTSLHGTHWFCLRAGELSSIRQLSTVRLHCHSVIPGTHFIRRQAPCAPPSRPRALTTQENATPLLKQEWLPTKSPPQCTSSLSELRAARSGGRRDG